MKLRYGIDIDVAIERLIRARLEKGWSREKLADKIGRSANMIYKIEQGERTSEETIFRMAKALGVPMKEILTEDGDAA